MIAYTEHPTARPLFELPGEWRIYLTDQHADFFVRDLFALLVEQDLGPAFGPRRLRAGWVAIHRTFLEELEGEDQAERIRHHAEVFLDHVFRPWRYPDPGWPLFDLFPRWTRARAALRDLSRTLALSRSLERPTR